MKLVFVNFAMFILYRYYNFGNVLHQKSNNVEIIISYFFISNEKLTLLNYTNTDCHMVGIENIASYIPGGRRSNYDLKEKFSMEDAFIETKIGVREVSIKADSENTSDMCVKAFSALTKKTAVELGEIECMVVVTQDPDFNIPHTSAIVHGALGLPESCACFDISLGCSGFVYGLSAIQAFMQQNGMKKGLLFTADPYSKIMDKDDKNTSILFGDAAAVTLISENPVFESGKFNFGTIGKEHENLICRDGVLSMNGRAIFNFAARYVPKDVMALLGKNNMELNDIDQFVFHQGSKYIVDTIARKLRLDAEKVSFDINHYGNTISSSIPIILEKLIEQKEYKKLLISGFGVGLSWSSTVLSRIN
jgi:3-oxoacyl-[acyl-carrier-protein] synthase-3